MRSNIATVLLLVSSACSSTKPDPLAAARAAAPNVVRAVAQEEKSRIEAASVAINELAAMDAAVFVHPVIGERTRILGERLAAANTSNLARVGAGTWLALSSDGAIYTSAGAATPTPFSRPFGEVEAVRDALLHGREGSGLLAFPVGGTEHARLLVAPVKSQGAVVGAVVLIVALTDDASALQTKARATPAGREAVTCVRKETQVACSNPSLAGRIGRAAVGQVANVGTDGVVTAAAAANGFEVVTYLPKATTPAN